MNNFRRVPLLAVLALVLVVVGILSSTATSVDPSQLPSALALNGHAESTALYCTGFSSDKLGESGRVILLNTTARSHEVTIDHVSNLGVAISQEMTLRAYQQYGFDPSVGVRGDFFGVGAQVSGGGVVGVEVTKDHTSEAPCISTGITNWFAAGFDTTVGSSAILSVYNPTETPAVFNVSTFSSSGYVAPQRFQGYAVAAHSDPARAESVWSWRRAGPDHGDLPSGHDGQQRHRADSLLQSRAHAGERHAEGDTGQVSRAEPDVDGAALRQRRCVDHAQPGHPGGGLRERGDDLESAGDSGARDGHGKRRRVKRADLARTGVLGGRLHGPGIRRGDAHQHLVTIDLDRRHDTARCDVASGAITPGGGFDRECAQPRSGARGSPRCRDDRECLTTNVVGGAHPADQTGGDDGRFGLRRPVGSAAANRAAVV